VHSVEGLPAFSLCESANVILQQRQRTDSEGKLVHCTMCDGTVDTTCKLGELIGEEVGMTAEDGAYGKNGRQVCYKLALMGVWLVGLDGRSAVSYRKNHSEW